MMPSSGAVDLTSLNTFHIEAFADRCVTIQSREELLGLLPVTLPVPILGGGSNVLFTQRRLEEVWLNRIKGIQIIREENDSVWVQFASGELWHDAVLWAIDHGYGGIENLSLIPGTVGAAPMQNIGAYGVELKDVFDSLEAVDLFQGEIKTFTHQACAFGYRESIFKHEAKDRYFILSVTLQLKKAPTINIDYGSIQDELKAMGLSAPYSIKQVSDAVIRIRKSKLPDPAEIGNAGSFFKNPVISSTHFKNLQSQYPSIPHYAAGEDVKVPAAWLIEQCGWKGYRSGDIGVHQKQALVLVNYQHGKGEDILQLSEQIIQSVQEKFQIELHREVNIW